MAQGYDDSIAEQQGERKRVRTTTTARMTGNISKMRILHWDAPLNRYQVASSSILGDRWAGVS